MLRVGSIGIASSRLRLREIPIIHPLSSFIVKVTSDAAPFPTRPSRSPPYIPVGAHAGASPRASEDKPYTLGSTRQLPAQLHPPPTHRPIAALTRVEGDHCRPEAFNFRRGMLVCTRESLSVVHGDKGYSSSRGKAKGKKKTRRQMHGVRGMDRGMKAPGWTM